MDPGDLLLLRHLAEDQLLDFGQLRDSREVRLLHVQLLLGVVQDRQLIGDDEGDQLGPEGVSIDEDLGDEWGLEVDVLDLLGGDVLALGKLEDVLLAVDDLGGKKRRGRAWMGVP